MANSSMEEYLTGRSNAPSPASPPPQQSPMDMVKNIALIALVLAMGYQLFDTYQFRQKNQAQLDAMSSQIQTLENRTKVGEAVVTSLKGDLSETQQQVGSTRAEIKKTAQQIQSEGAQTKAELSRAISSKADAAQVQAVKSETEAKIGQVSSEVGGVKSEVGGVKTEVNVVKTDLATTRRDLEGTQRQLVDVRETLTAAVAKNSAELAELRRKGEKDFFEFEIPKKNLLTKVEDIRVILTRTDPTKGKYNVVIVVDDSRIEKKDRTVNEPVLFLVGRNRVRYELVVNWIQKDKAGGYLAIPKDKALSADRPAVK